MPQFYPDGPSAVNLNSIQENGGINIPPEPAGEFETPGMQGSMQQLLSENLGKFVIADFLIGVSSIVRRVGILYSVGRSFVVLYHEDYHTFQVCDIFSLKFVAFFPPGFEPSMEDLLEGSFTSGILNPGTSSGILRPEPLPGGSMFEPRSQGSGPMNGAGMSSMNGTGLGGSTGSSSMSGHSMNGSSMNGNSNSMGGNSMNGGRGSMSGCRTLGQR